MNTFDTPRTGREELDALRFREAAFQAQQKSWQQVHDMYADLPYSEKGPIDSVFDEMLEALKQAFPDRNFSMTDDAERLVAEITRYALGPPARRRAQGCRDDGFDPHLLPPHDSSLMEGAS